MPELKDRFRNQTERIIYMEELCDRICAVLESECCVRERLMELQDEIKELEAYYEGPEWREDLDADRRGELPTDLKRGILAEDTLYDLLCDVDQILGDHMLEKIHQTACGPIHYWVNEFRPGRSTIAFLPGLTADHRLFDRQIDYFRNRYNVFVWDAPGHAASWPFRFEFSLMDKAKWLHEIMEKEHAENLVIAGQSMGGYVGQVYAGLYPSELKGFVSIDSAPLQRKYVTSAELWLLKRMEPVYRHYPWKALLKSGANGVAVSEYGRNLMKEMMLVYEGNQARYAKLSGHGFKILAEAMEGGLPYKLPENSLLICGEKDKAGSCIRYNRAWHKQTGIRLEWIPNAGHNSNTDQPERINGMIEKVVRKCS